MEKVIFSNNGGMGIVLEPGERECDFFEFKKINLVGEVIKPGIWHDLFGKFNKPLRFVGAPAGSNNLFALHLGEHEGVNYYSVWMYISPTRIGNKYREGSFRDFNWKQEQNKWK